MTSTISQPLATSGSMSREINRGLVEEGVRHLLTGAKVLSPESIPMANVFNGLGKKYLTRLLHRSVQMARALGTPKKVYCLFARIPTPLQQCGISSRCLTDPQQFDTPVSCVSSRGCPAIKRLVLSPALNLDLRATSTVTAY